MGRYYNERDEAAGCLTSFLFSAIIIVFFVWLATIAIYYIFIGVAVLSAIIGTIISLKNYVVSLKNSLSFHRNDIVPQYWKLPAFIYKWQKISFESLKDCWRSNIKTLKTLFQQGIYYRFISIRRWFYWFVGISVALFGFVVSIAIELLGFIVLITIVVLLTAAVILIFVLMVLVALFDSVRKVIINFYTLLRAQIKASHAASLVEYIKKWGYKGTNKMPYLLWDSSNKIFLTCMSLFYNSSILSFSKWLSLGRAIMIYPVAIFLIPSIFILQIIAQSVLYLCLLWVK